MKSISQLVESATLSNSRGIRYPYPRILASVSGIHHRSSERPIHHSPSLSPTAASFHFGGDYATLRFSEHYAFYTELGWN
ncbi:hypothetical protein K1719_034268 [Acacia pycnantha]|nr:hypothetical protein K1719_034268 [Acacia pycnantha]